MTEATISSGGTAPLVNGTVVYFVLMVVAMVLVFCARLMGFSKGGNLGVHLTFVVISVFSMWVVWAAAWLHQWHPLILPLPPSDK